MATYIYLDWNVFNKIEKVDTLPAEDKWLYSEIRDQVTSSKITVPYSNAHINDLARGYKKDSRFADEHLRTITQLTSNLCITQYWNDNKVTWHFRDPVEFLTTTLKDSENNNALEGFLSEDDSGLSRIPFQHLKYRELPKEFAELYQGQPLYDIMFPKTKVAMTYYAFGEDMFDFVYNIKRDFALYKQFRKLINESRNKLPESKPLFDNIDKSITKIPSQLKFDQIWEKYKVKKNSRNANFQLILDAYHKLDLGGFMQDEKFANLIDDSLHVYYGAQCELFVTNDDKCLQKAKKVYETLQLNTKAIKPHEFRQWLNS